jgi:hypothetical protein
MQPQISVIPSMRNNNHHNRRSSSISAITIFEEEFGSQNLSVREDDDESNIDSHHVDMFSSTIASQDDRFRPFLCQGSCSDSSGNNTGPLSQPQRRGSVMLAPLPPHHHPTLDSVPSLPQRRGSILNKSLSSGDRCDVCGGNTAQHGDFSSPGKITMRMMPDFSKTILPPAKPSRQLSSDSDYTSR